MIVGSSFNDSLNGGAGRDVIVGAAGVDSIHGNDGDDLIFAMGLNKQSDVVAMTTMSAKWSDANSPLSTRRTNVKALFATNNPIADNGGNLVWGDAGNDWMNVNRSLDKLKDVVATDVVN